ncbi:competence protein ComGF [Halalkalibacter oceani]
MIMKNVFTPHDEKGFTLLEMLLVLSLILLLLSLFPLMMNVNLSASKVFPGQDQEVTMFFNHLSKDIREATEVVGGRNQLLIEKGGNESLFIELMPSQQIRRLRNGLGHVLLLERVRSFSCRTTGRLVHCEVELTAGVKKQRTMAMLYPYERREAEGD